VMFDNHDDNNSDDGQVLRPFGLMPRKIMGTTVATPPSLGTDDHTQIYHGSGGNINNDHLAALNCFLGKQEQSIVSSFPETTCGHILSNSHEDREDHLGFSLIDFIKAQYAEQVCISFQPNVHFSY
jgi:hypothetical protein